MNDPTAEATAEGAFEPKWNGGELIELCKQKRNRDIEAYWNSLIWHDDLAQFFAERAIEAWDNTTFYDTVIACEAYVVACIQFMNPLADMLSQIITIAVFEGPHKEKDVRANEISDKLEKEKAYGIKNSWDKFYNSDEFSYVNAFCNKIKHRRLVRTGAIRFNFAETTGGDGNEFMPFEYNGKRYPNLTVSTIVGQYRQRIHGFVFDTGVSINDYLKDLQSKS